MTVGLVGMTGIHPILTAYLETSGLTVTFVLPSALFCVYALRLPAILNDKRLIAPMLNVFVTDVCLSVIGIAAHLPPGLHWYCNT